MGSYLVVSTPIAGDVNTGEAALWQTLAKVALYAIVGCTAVAVLVLGESNGFERLLSAAPVVRLGEISYEIFLLHVIIMEIVMASVLHWPVFTGLWPVVFVVTLAIDDSAGLATASVDTAELDYFFPSNRWAYGSLSAPTDSGIG